MSSREVWSDFAAEIGRHCGVFRYPSDNSHISYNFRHFRDSHADTRPARDHIVAAAIGNGRQQMTRSGPKKSESRPMRHLFTTLFLALTSTLSCLPALAAPVKAAARSHPLDPLSKPEIATIVSVLKATGKVTPDTRF